MPSQSKIHDTETETDGMTAPRSERRKRSIPAATDRRKPTSGETEQDPSLPNQEDDEETAFKKAMDRYKRENRRPFPTWSEVLEVLRSLGYRKVAEESDFPNPNKDGTVPPAKG